MIFHWLTRAGSSKLFQRQILPSSRNLVTSKTVRKQGNGSEGRQRTFYSAFGSFLLVCSAGFLIYSSSFNGEEKVYLESEQKKKKSRGTDLVLSPSAVETALAHSKPFSESGDEIRMNDMPREKAILTTAPEVPPAITRDHPAIVEVPLKATTKVLPLTSAYKYEKWTFNDTVPGPFIRARVGDVVEISLTNKDETGNPHNIDSHAFLGPGGGAALTTVSEGETKKARFRLQFPGLFVYHCAAAPVPVHIANGMYGLMYVQPEDQDLPKVDHEYYVLQSEFYHEPPDRLDDGSISSVVDFSYPNALKEEPQAVVFNGHEAALTRDKPLKAKVDETVRIYFGNIGPNLSSAFHVIGGNFSNLYTNGDVINPPARFVQTTCVPPGSATIVDMKMAVPGTYTLVDHAIFRLDKGAVGYLNVSGSARPDVYQGDSPAAPCIGCKLHP